MSHSMSTDPLMNLPPDRIPEPSQARMNETVAAAQQLFASQLAVRADRSGTNRRPFVGRTWMEAILGAGFLATACVLIFTLSPAFMHMLPAEQQRLPREAFRTGVRQTPDMRPADLDIITALEPFTVGDLKLGVRNVDNRFGVYFVGDKGVEQELISGRKAPGETVSITDAVLSDWAGRKVLAVRSGFGKQQRWDAFVHDGFRFAPSSSLSRMIWDAGGGEEVQNRLGAVPAMAD